MLVRASLVGLADARRPETNRVADGKLQQLDQQNICGLRLSGMDFQKVLFEVGDLVMRFGQGMEIQ